MRELRVNSALSRLIDRFSCLPGIGRRSAERIGFYLLKQPPEVSEELANAIREFRLNLKVCRTCSNVSESDPCSICADSRRDPGRIMVVEQSSDIVMIESTGIFRGLYHVLMGRLAPLEGIDQEELNIPSLLKRASDGDVREVILATNPTMDGDGTALYLARTLREAGVRITRLARGLPTGSSLDMVSKAVLTDAIDSRQTMEH